MDMDAVYPARRRESSSTHGVDQPCRPRSTPTKSRPCRSDRSRKSVRGGAVWVGRTVGAMDGAIEPPRTGLRRVLPTHTAPPSHGIPAVAVAVAVDSAGAGRSPADNPSPLRMPALVVIARAEQLWLDQLDERPRLRRQ